MDAELRRKLEALVGRWKTCNREYAFDNDNWALGVETRYERAAWDLEILLDEED